MFMVAALLFVGLISCERYEVDNSTGIVNNRPDTQSPELTKNHIGLWQMESITLNDSIDQPIDSCNRDNLFAFHFDGYFELRHGEIRCANEAEVESGNWEFQQDKTVLQIVYASGYIGVFDLIQLDNVNLIISGPVYENDGSLGGFRTIHFRAMNQ